MLDLWDEALLHMLSLQVNASAHTHTTKKKKKKSETGSKRLEVEHAQECYESGWDNMISNRGSTYCGTEIMEFCFII